MNPRRKSKQPEPPALAPRRKWLFRVMAVAVVPLALLVVLEAALRLAGYGYETSLFEKARFDGQDFWVNNEQFGSRFFPPELSRWTLPIKMPSVNPAGVYRIFIFGESAAQGDPAPAFGAGRYLEVLLRERYPGVNFEVVNLGITAIDSHVILPMARECAHYNRDLWIIYMGNNEMVGPFGAATVFGAKAPGWPQVRLGLALQTTRIGQLLMNLARKFRSDDASPRSWSGMEMFLGNQLAPDDPRKQVVYQNFQRNLDDIVQAGRKSGASVLLSTVAVNLKDCPPFASMHLKSLTEADRQKCERLCADGRVAESRSDWKMGAADFADAATLDPQWAEAEFGQGRCLLQLGNAASAATDFQKACDCDALAFRADSRINDIIRQSARQFAGPNLALCDASAKLSPGIPGQDDFYEHVHFNFDGNYRLARLWAPEAERLLPDAIKGKAKSGWASRRHARSAWD